MSRALDPAKAEALRQELAAYDAGRQQETSETEEHLALLRRARSGEPGARKAVLKTVSTRLGLAVPITGVVKVTSDPPEFHLLLADPEPTRLRLGGVEHLDTQTLFGRAFLLALGWKPNRVKDWDPIVTQLASCADDEKPDEATTDAGRGRRWIGQYLNATADPVDLTNFEKEERKEHALDIGKSMLAFRDEKGLQVFLPAVQRTVRQLSFGGENPTTDQVSRCLLAAGCRRESPKFPKPTGKGGVTTRSTWLVPTELDPGPPR